jgi:hypothetical protein
MKRLSAGPSSASDDKWAVYAVALQINNHSSSLTSLGYGS